MKITLGNIHCIACILSHTKIGIPIIANLQTKGTHLKAHLLAKFVVPPVEDIRIFFPCIWPNIFDGVVASALAVESILAGDLAGQTHAVYVGWDWRKKGTCTCMNLVKM